MVWFLTKDLLSLHPNTSVSQAGVRYGESPIETVYHIAFHSLPGSLDEEEET